MPTETSYMLGGDAGRMETMLRLRRLKGRPSNQNLSVMFSSVEKAARWTDWNDLARRLAERYLPGPITLILPLKAATRQYATADQTLGIRIPGHPFLLDLLEPLEFPVTATSANPHGGIEPYTADACVSPVDVVWDAGELFPDPPSTIVDLAGDSPRVIRQGSIRVDLSI